MGDLERDREIMGYWEQKKYSLGGRYAVNERFRPLERLEKNVDIIEDGNHRQNRNSVINVRSSC